jgi:hypothetical protein
MFWSTFVIAAFLAIAALLAPHISGGGQVSVGVAPLLRKWPGAPVYVISYGGIFSNDPGLDWIRHLYHLSGSPAEAVNRVDNLLE